MAIVRPYPGPIEDLTKELEPLMQSIFDRHTGEESKVLVLSRTEYSQCSRNFAPQELWVEALKAVQALGERRARGADCHIYERGDVLHGADPDGAALRAELAELTNRTSVPSLFRVSPSVDCSSAARASTCPLP